MSKFNLLNEYVLSDSVSRGTPVVVEEDGRHVRAANAQDGRERIDGITIGDGEKGATFIAEEFVLPALRTTVLRKE